jgi:hypothetical protein
MSYHTSLQKFRRGALLLWPMLMAVHAAHGEPIAGKDLSAGAGRGAAPCAYSDR